ncbi:uncharacterized protein LOC143018300 [Oratosquilla oratoria]|uniref:uncharacterized protein LOC143018300 n=1 Tax=Oratosquilla oratoria TaxID=337810 RepID=UPI003F76FAD9
MLVKLANHFTETILPKTQCVFRKDRGTTDMIFPLCQIQEKSHEQNRDLYLAFIDLRKAFDIVNREFLWSVLHKFGTPPKFLNTLKSFRDGMNACVLPGGQKSEPFTVDVGGCP